MLLLPGTEAACLAIDVEELCELRTSAEAAWAAWALVCALIGLMEGSDRLPRVVIPVMREWDDAHCAWDKGLVAVDYEGDVQGY